MSGLVFLIDDSDEEEVTEIKAEQELGVIHSWMEMGGFPALPKEEAWGLLCEVCYFLLSHFFHGSPTTPSLVCCTNSFSSLLFLGYRTIEEGGKTEGIDAEEVSEGWEKIGAAVAGSKVEDLYGLLRGVIAQSSMSHFHPKDTTTPQPLLFPNCPPQEPEEVPEASTPAGNRQFWHQRSPFSQITSFGGGSPHQYATPLPAIGGTKRVYKCQVEGCTEGSSTSHTTICTHVHRVYLGVGLVCPSVANLSSIQMHSGTMGKVILISYSSVNKSYTLGNC